MARGDKVGRVCGPETERRVLRINRYKGRRVRDVLTGTQFTAPFALNEILN